MPDVPDFTPATWMGDLLVGSYAAKTIPQLTLPGTHDSGAYHFTVRELDGSQNRLVRLVHEAAEAGAQEGGLKGLFGKITASVISDVVEKWGKAQNLDIDGQLTAGVRWLDLRTGMFDGAPHLYHGFAADPVSDVLDTLAAFLRDYPREIVCLYFSHFDNFDAAHHQVLQDLIHTKLGATKICQNGNDFQSMTVAQLQTAGIGAVVFYDDAEERSRPGNQWLLDQTAYYYSPKIEARTLDGLVTQCAAGIAAAQGKPVMIGFTPTEEQDDVIDSIADALDPFPHETHDLHWFTQDARSALSGWIAGQANTPLGIISTDFYDETELLTDCLLHMGIDISPPPPGIAQSVGACYLGSGSTAFLLGTDGRLWQATLANSRVTWQDRGQPRGVSLSAVVGVTAIPEGSDLDAFGAFLIGSDGQLWEGVWRQGSWAWTPRSAPDGVSIQTGLACLPWYLWDSPDAPLCPSAFVIDSNGHLQVGAEIPGFGWKWFDHGTPAWGVGIDRLLGTMQTRTMVVPVPWLFVRGTDGGLWYRRYSLNNEWEWGALGVPDEHSIGVGLGLGFAGSSGRFRSYVRGTDGNVWLCIQDDGVNWTNLRTPPNGVGIAASGGGASGNTAIPVEVGASCAAVIGTDSHLWLVADTGTWYDAGSPAPGVLVASAVGVAPVLDYGSQDLGGPDVFALGSDQRLYVGSARVSDSGDITWSGWIAAPTPGDPHDPQGVA